jgi:hypothetical protein
MIVDINDFHLYARGVGEVESLQVREFVHTRVDDVNLLEKGEMDVDLPILFHAVGWSFVMIFLGSPLLVEEIRGIEHTLKG